MIRLTAAQAMVRWLGAQRVESEGEVQPYFAGCWAIFGHGNVAGLGEALASAGDLIPTWRAHNEQAMAHAAIAFAKQSRRRRAMVCTTSVGPGATNMVTAAALAHVNRLPVLLVPGDIFAGRRPDPVLQQVENFSDATVSANDCFRPVSRYFDRITRAEQLLASLPRAMSVLTDPAQCGPATIAFCQDVQAEAADWPEAFFAPRTWRLRRQSPDSREIADLVDLLTRAKRPMIVAGGGVRYAGAETRLREFASRFVIPVAETQAGKGALVWDDPMSVGAVGVTGTSAANALVRQADLVIGVGTRLQDFTTGSAALIPVEGQRLVQINVAGFDAHKHGALAVVGDADATLDILSSALGPWRTPSAWTAKARRLTDEWTVAADAAMKAPAEQHLPTDAQVLGAVWRQTNEDTVVVAAAGGLPGELHRLWRTRSVGGYHVEYGYSCMGYEIAGALGVKMAAPERDVHVVLGDGSYLMMNSEIATSVMLGLKLTITVLDNRGFGCINRLQQSVGGRPFNNLLSDTEQVVAPDIDFAAHAASLGAKAEKVAGIAELEAALHRAAGEESTVVIVIDTDPDRTSEIGGAWWDVAVPEVSERPEVRAARATYDAALSARARGEKP
ncbi:MAG: 3D-(3,5/4)-trihydroxycyclohexane-1,2-dione acylhydrolase (decyclizing) [Alphaproteobacteria bacterium]|nr:3D-(3,5/4)-trihydroxycyclohexane-1,2-dione acylhydrolase (decyclizing) [Alphaproteobacteria bacterium]